jgi:membrane protein DedA with SNARE-associated domain
MEFFAHLENLWHAIALFFQNVDIHQMVQEHRSWFYTIAFVWAFLEGETFLIFAGAAASKGMLDVKLLIAAAWAGSVCGDQLYFFLGRKYGTRILKRFPKVNAIAQKVFVLIKKHDVLFILTYRFLWTVRNFSSFSLGCANVSWKKFAPLNVIAAFIWAVVFSMTGYLFGEVLDEVHYALIGVLVLVILLFVAHWGVKKWSASREKKAKGRK